MSHRIYRTILLTFNGVLFTYLVMSILMQEYDFTKWEQEYKAYTALQGVINGLFVAIAYEIRLSLNS